MQIFKTVVDMRQWVQSGKQRLAFVPTMGALHEGHLSLIRRAKALSDRVVVSIFVNPTQFNDLSDLRKYPRTEEADLAKCEQEQVDAVFLPSVPEMYPEGPKNTVAVPEFTKVLCGASRPGHFEGVATVVLRLFEMVTPDLAVFGEKDYQQLLLIRWLTQHYQLPIEIVSHPIVREADGLAMSSRNRRLALKDRQQALVLYQSIQTVQAAFKTGVTQVDDLLARAQRVLASQPEVKVDYAELRDAETLNTIKKVTKPALYAVAAFVGPPAGEVGTVRLIDNCVLQKTNN